MVNLPDGVSACAVTHLVRARSGAQRNAATAGQGPHLKLDPPGPSKVISVQVV
jgi:hypothetical protein